MCVEGGFRRSEDLAVRVKWEVIDVIGRAQWGSNREQPCDLGNGVVKNIRLEVLAAIKTSMVVFWVVTP
jgi:hypothetical protein